ncbi:acyltransferase [Cellvibrio zantedeschiae]|uniref:Acyltransferase n=1 Tax=Cellvibrio zantedeschiae TaxID=1237077 RepID=A0ABQ3B757_9GAMM|nr:acyltransferase [Cellvibrio zantedeschiae]GGY82226.1 acyltransferase [Cellvibrio zantedeschiae]
MKRLELLDYARFFAALAVIAFHYSYNGIANGKVTSIAHIPGLIEVTKYGYLGVELFFMISGYVIFFSAKNHSAAEFAKSRAIRLMPCYWFAVLLTATFMYLWGSNIGKISGTQVLVNMTMLQSFIGFPPIDGVYWTLAYEITFYFAVFLILLFGMGKHLEKIFIAWPVLMIAAKAMDLDGYSYLGGYFSYFAAGALFAILKNKKNLIVWISLLISLYLCASFSVAQTIEMANRKNIDFSQTTVIAVILACFMLFFFLQSNLGSRLTLPYSKTLGALTYPVYLIHAHIGYILLNMFANDSNKIYVYLMIFSAIIATSYLMHFLIEQKLSFFWRSLFAKTIESPLEKITFHISKRIKALT